MSEEPLILRAKDVSRAGLCASGMREWLRLREIDLNDFLANGIAADDERIAGDAYIAKIIAKKRGR